MYCWWEFRGLLEIVCSRCFYITFRVCYLGVIWCTSWFSSWSSVFRNVNTFVHSDRAFSIMYKPMIYPCIYHRVLIMTHFSTLPWINITLYCCYSVVDDSNLLILSDDKRNIIYFISTRYFKSLNAPALQIGAHSMTWKESEHFKD